jgi:type IV secretion system protein TrbF
VRADRAPRTCIRPTREDRNHDAVMRIGGEAPRRRAHSKPRCKDHSPHRVAATSASPFYQPTDPQIAFHLARFIEDVRGLPTDAIVLRQDWLRAYDFTTDRGATALNDYARTNDPFAKLGNTQVAVEISSVIRSSPNSFRVAWTERRYDNGQLAATERWTAIISIVIETPRDADRLRKNPLGIYVNSINWSKELG